MSFGRIFLRICKERSNLIFFLSVRLWFLGLSTKELKVLCILPFSCDGRSGSGVFFLFGILDREIAM